MKHVGQWVSITAVLVCSTTCWAQLGVSAGSNRMISDTALVTNGSPAGDLANDTAQPGGSQRFGIIAISPVESFGDQGDMNATPSGTPSLAQGLADAVQSGRMPLAVIDWYSYRGNVYPQTIGTLQGGSPGGGMRNLTGMSGNNYNSGTGSSVQEMSADIAKLKALFAASNNEVEALKAEVAALKSEIEKLKAQP